MADTTLSHDFAEYVEKFYDAGIAKCVEEFYDTGGVEVDVMEELKDKTIEQLLLTQAELLNAIHDLKKRVEELELKGASPIESVGLDQQSKADIINMLKRKSMWDDNGDWI